MKHEVRERSKPGSRSGPALTARKPVRVEINTVLAIILVSGLLVRLVHFWSISHTPFTRFPLVIKATDLYANWEWAQTILAGDLLGRETYHPYFDWMRNIAPVEQWYQWWGGKEIFQQAPLYAYWAAGLLAASINSLNFVLFVQLLVGSLQPLIMFLLGRRFFDEFSGLLAAALTAFYGPFVFHQGVLLRDWLPPLLDALGLLLLLRARSRGRGLDYLLAGAVLGTALLTKETVLLFLPLVLLWLAWEERFAFSRFLPPAVFLLGGVLLAVSPLLIRNALVGAPLLALSNRAAESIIEGNAADILPIGMNPPPSMKGILERSGGKLVPVIHETLQTYRGDWLKFAEQQILKVRALIDSREVPNNTSFYYGLEISPILSFTLRYAIIFPLALTGAIFAVFHRRASLLLVLYGIATLAGLLAAPVMARYRLMLVPVLILYAAAGLAWLVESFRKTKFLAALGYLSAVLFLVAAQYVVRVPYARNSAADLLVHGGLEYYFSAVVYAEDHQFEKSIAEMQRLEERALETPNPALYSNKARYQQGNFYVKWAEALLKDGDRVGAKEKANQAESAFVPFFHLTEPNVTMGVLYYDLEEREKARGFLNRALLINFEGPDAETAKKYLAKLQASQDRPAGKEEPSSEAGFQK
jgi:4-amino-4-deoxy-L-arabinose transferase-like glycosyltransferase